MAYVKQTLALSSVLIEIIKNVLTQTSLCLALLLNWDVFEVRAKLGVGAKRHLPGLGSPLRVLRLSQVHIEMILN